MKTESNGYFKEKLENIIERYSNESFRVLFLKKTHPIVINKNVTRT